MKSRRYRYDFSRSPSFKAEMIPMLVILTVSLEPSAKSSLR